MNTSPRFSLTLEDWASFGKGVFKYTAPLLLIFLVALQAGQPIKYAIWLVYGGAVQLAINFLTKYLGGEPQPKGPAI